MVQLRIHLYKHVFLFSHSFFTTSRVDALAPLNYGWFKRHRGPINKPTLVFSNSAPFLSIKNRKRRPAIAQKFPRQIGKFRPSPKFNENRPEHFTRPIAAPPPSNAFNSDSFFTEIPTFDDEFPNYEPEVYQEPDVYHDQEVYHKPVAFHNPEVYHVPEVYQDHDTNIPSRDQLEYEPLKEYHIRGGTLPQHANLLDKTFGRGRGEKKSPSNGQFHNFLIHQHKILANLKNICVFD